MIFTVFRVIQRAEPNYNTEMESKVKVSNPLSVGLAVVLASFMVGCGSGGEEEPVADIQPIDVQPAAAAKPSSGKKKPRASARSAADRIDDALDRGNYMAAVDIAVKSGKTPAERMDNIRFVQSELGDPMARGDKKAMQAYQKLNAVWLMMNNAPR